MAPDILHCLGWPQWKGGKAPVSSGRDQPWVCLAKSGEESSRTWTDPPHKDKLANIFSLNKRTRVGTICYNYSGKNITYSVFWVLLDLNELNHIFSFIDTADKTSRCGSIQLWISVKKSTLYYKRHFANIYLYLLDYIPKLNKLLASKNFTKANFEILWSCRQNTTLLTPLRLLKSFRW